MRCRGTTERWLKMIHRFIDDQEDDQEEMMEIIWKRKD